MDLQHQLKKVANYLVEGARNSRVYVHPPQLNNLWRYCVVVNIERNNISFKGSASDKNLFSAFIKALCETGENIIIEESNLESRSGIAGGLLLGRCIERAKAELIERDAFLYHYKNLIPFNEHESLNNGSSSFQLNSVDSGFKVQLVINSDYLVKPETCLILGTGCDKSKEEATEKAFSEFTAMYFNHKSFIECEGQTPNLHSQSKTDFHHLHSRSMENKLIFNKLCNHEDHTPLVVRNYDKNLWSIAVLKSPIRFFQYVKVYHPQLYTLKFGTPEYFEIFKSKVFHPFW